MSGRDRREKSEKHVHDADESDESARTGPCLATLYPELSEKVMGFIKHNNNSESSQDVDQLLKAVQNQYKNFDDLVLTAINSSILGSENSINFVFMMYRFEQNGIATPSKLSVGTMFKQIYHNFDLTFAEMEEDCYEEK